MLWLMEKNATNTLRIERPGCAPYTAFGIIFIVARRGRACKRSAAGTSVVGSIVCR